MKYRIALLAALFPAAAWAWPWSTDMADQPAIEPQSPVSEDRLEMHPFPSRSVPVTGLQTQVANREEADSLVNPIPVSDESLKKGRTLFRIYCGACHGNTGHAESPVSSKIGAPPLVDDRIQNGLSEGWLWGTITFGSYLMPAYGAPSARPDGRGSNDLDAQERWHIVNYLRHGLAKEQAPVRTAQTQ
jgi:mono/diheme cytochrome c family protein